MGYFSEVAITCEPKAYEMFKELFSGEDFGAVPDKIMVNREHICEGESEIYLFHWEYVRWYDDNEDIQAIYKVLDELDDEHHCEEGYAYSFYRVGEENGDEDERDNGHDNGRLCLYLKRTIDFMTNFTEKVGEEVHLQ